MKGVRKDFLGKCVIWKKGEKEKYKRRLEKNERKAEKRKTTVLETVKES